jgi:hypothetical protein
MAKKSEMKRLQRRRSRRKSRERTSKKDKMKTPTRRKNGIRKTQKTKRRRTKKSRNEGKGEAGGLWGWRKTKTRILQERRLPQQQPLVTEVDQNDVTLILEEEKGEEYKNNLVNELLILLEKNTAVEDKEKRMILALESCKKREKLRIEYMEKFNRLRLALREINVFKVDGEKFKGVPPEPASAVEKIREILSEISEDDGAREDS